jgi:hypothetical protein
MRLTAFVAAASSVYLATRLEGTGRIAALVGAGAALLAFVLLARRHAAERERAEWEEELRRGCELGERRVLRAWDRLPASPVADPDPSHPYARDLDVSAHASLAQLLDTVSAFPGRGSLAGALLAPLPPTAAGVRARQEGARELAAAREFRETLAAHARRMGDVHADQAERFLAWAEERPSRASLPWVRSLAVALPIGTVVLLSLHSGGMIARAWWLATVAAALLLTWWLRRDTGRAIRAASSRASGLASHAAMLACVERADFRTGALAALRERLRAAGGAAESLAELQRTARFAEARYSPMAHGLLQALLVWDVHVAARLERWQARAGRHARDWLAALGELEVLAAIGTLAHDNPSWCWPEVAEDAGARLEFVALGHPLIPDAERVTNDVSLGPPGTFLLVTGSNMSGKTTLLRSIGLALVLTRAGGPVCAARARLPLAEVWTSIRIEDSLERGMSLFMAELERIARVVEAARGAGAAGRPFVFLLDEILHGTNSAERRTAARTVLSHLVAARALGAITTHDLALAEEDALRAVATPVHFTESFTREPGGGERMTFDYRLLPGIATSANALRLLAMVGLGDAPGGPPASRAAT